MPISTPKSKNLFNRLKSYSQVLFLLISVDMTPEFKPFTAHAVLPKYANKNTVPFRPWSIEIYYDLGSFEVQLY